MRTFLLTAAVTVAACVLPVHVLAASQNPFDALDPGAKTFLVAAGVLEAQLDGSLLPSPTVSRVEFVRSVIDYRYPESVLNTDCLNDLDSHGRSGLQYSLLFSDVRVDSPYALHLCQAIRTGMVWGYSDGSFHPDQRITFAEAAKVINHAFGWEYQMPDYPWQVWHESYTYTLKKHMNVPENISKVDHTMTASDMRMLLERAGSRIGATTDRKPFARMPSTTSVQKLL